MVSSRLTVTSLVIELVYTGISKIVSPLIDFKHESALDAWRQTAPITDGAKSEACGGYNDPTDGVQ